MLKYLILIILTALLTYLLQDSLVTLKYEAYKDALSSLSNVSSIIFAIIGAWITIIYPKAINRVFSSQSSNNSEIQDSNGDANYLGKLVEIVMVSAIVLMTVIAIQFSVPIIKEIVNPELLRSGKYGMFFVVAMLTFMQLNAVFRVILANYYFLNRLRNKNNNEQFNQLHN